MPPEHDGGHTVLTKTLITIGIFLSLFSYASAQTANSYPASWQRPGSSDTDYSWGFGISDRDTFLKHAATTTLAGITTISPDLCYTTSNSGEIYLEVWYQSTSTLSNLVASSSVAVSSLPLCYGPGPGYYGSTTPFVLNHAFNASIGDVLLIRMTRTSGSGSVYITGDLTATPTHFLFLAGGVPFVYTGKYTDAFAKLGSGLLPYTTSWSNIVASAKSNECEGIFECAFAWAFYPDPADIEQFKNLSLASSSPFGYIYDMDDALQAFMSGLNATTSSFKITLDMTTLKNTAEVFNGVSTSSITVFDICWVNRAIGELPANSFRDKFLPMIVYMMWIGLGWLFYSVAHKTL